MTTATETTAAKTITCQWRGIPIAGIPGEPCDKTATLTGASNDRGEQHLCTEHMAQRQAAAYGGYSYTWVWPCLPNGFYGRSDLEADARRLCR